VNRHPYFDLYLHDDAELGTLLGSPVCQRQTLQEWPLSCVQRITTSGGRKCIYKAQHEPTVEPEFYAKARSSLLIPARTIFRAGMYSAMLLDEIDGPTLEQLQFSESEALEFGRALLQQIAEINGELPCYLDISTEQKWTERMGLVLGDLKGLVEAGIFQSVHPEDLALLPCLGSALSDHPARRELERARQPVLRSGPMALRSSRTPVAGCTPVLR